MSETKEIGIIERLDKIEKNLSEIKSGIEEILTKLGGQKEVEENFFRKVYNNCPTEKELDEMEKKELDEFKKNNPEFA